MNVSQGRHAFWSVPRRPFLTNHPVRTVPLSLGRQFVGYPNPFLGQDQPSPVAPSPLPANRLDALTIPEIQNRILIAAPIQRMLTAQATGKQSNVSLTVPLDLLNAVLQNSQKTLPTLTSDQITALTAISQNPTQDEISDLAIIDAFFGTDALTPALCKLLQNPGDSANFLDRAENSRGGAYYGNFWLDVTPADIIAGWLFYSGTISSGSQSHYWDVTQSNTTPDERNAIMTNPFFCSPPASYPDIFYWGPKGNYGAWFSLDATQTWGALKMQVQNAITIMDVLAGYPFPPPIDQYPGTFWSKEMAGIQQIMNIGVLANPQAVDLWVTLATVQDYSAMVTQIETILKKKAKEQKRKAIMDGIGLAIASIVAAYVAPAIIAAAITVIKTAVTTYMEIEQRKEAAQNLEDTSKLFAKDAPAFSQKVSDAANTLDAASAAEQASAPPSPAIQAAIDEVPGGGISPLVPVGGIAAAGLAVLFLFK